jgi:uncharacterized membrane protein
MWAIGLVFIATIIGAYGSLYIKKASKNFKLTIKNLFNKKLIMGVGLYVLSTILFIGALRGGEVNVLYPLTALSYIWVALISTKVLKEKISRISWVGIITIIIGVILITL